MTEFESELRHVLQSEYDEVAFSELRTWACLGREQAFLNGEGAIYLYEHQVLNDSRLISVGCSHGVDVAEVIRDERYNAIQRLRKKAEEIIDEIDEIDI